MGYTRTQFISKVAPMAQKDAQNSKILASLTIAQAILESNNGNSTLTREGNALFGIKANSSWRGEVWTGSTIEYYSGNKTNVIAGFRAYDSWQDSITDHSKLITGYSRYKHVVGELNYEKACMEIQKAGYATDPNYAIKLIGIIKVNGLYKYDIADVTNTIDEPLYEAVRKIIRSGIIIDINCWKRLDLIKLENVPFLVCKLVGIEINGSVSDEQYRKAIDKLVEKGVINKRVIWDERTYSVENVRDLLLKSASKLK